MSAHKQTIDLPNGYVFQRCFGNRIIWIDLKDFSIYFIGIIFLVDSNQGDTFPKHCFDIGWAQPKTFITIVYRLLPFFLFDVCAFLARFTQCFFFFFWLVRRDIRRVQNINGKENGQKPFTLIFPFLFLLPIIILLFFFRCSKSNGMFKYFKYLHVKARLLNTANVAKHFILFVYSDNACSKCEHLKCSLPLSRYL